jgi:UPF0755 protein
MKKSYFTFFAILFFIFCFFYWGIFLPKSHSFEEKIFFVKKGEGLFEISKNLEKEGLIKNRIFFLVYIIFQRKEKSLISGAYSLSPSMNVKEIAKIITSGKIKTVKITIPEGYTIKDIEEKLNIKIENKALEGYLFPDTYYLPFGFLAEDLIKVMRENFENKIAPYKKDIEARGKTIHQILTLASLLEKEVKTKEDKELVAGILWKRLKFGMPLQVDATITYLTGKKTTKIGKEDLEIDSPYNTYKYKGLPPGPICNPGLESILAAIYPKESDYWYYLSTPEGKTIFSKTLKEHNVAKAQYLQ